MKRNFTKLQGLGNDFILFDACKTKITLAAKQIKKLADRRFGIGADQILLIEKGTKKADFKLTIYNADGGQVEMCGNGLRAVARYVNEKKLSSKKSITVETKAGVQEATLVDKNNICVKMGAPLLKGKEIPANLSGRIINRPLRVEGREFRITCVSMGNPHCVVFVNELNNYPVANYGPQLEHHNLFPKRTNVEFVQVLDKKHVKVRVWERGAGETLACGSGACATIVAGVLNNYTERKATVELPGGNLDIHWKIDDDQVYMTGPAELIFEGSVDV